MQAQHCFFFFFFSPPYLLFCNHTQQPSNAGSFWPFVPHKCSLTCLFWQSCTALWIQKVSLSHKTHQGHSHNFSICIKQPELWIFPVWIIASPLYSYLKHLTHNRRQPCSVNLKLTSVWQPKGPRFNFTRFQHLHCRKATIYQTLAEVLTTCSLLHVISLIYVSCKALTSLKLAQEHASSCSDVHLFWHGEEWSCAPASNTGTLKTGKLFTNLIFITFHYRTRSRSSKHTNGLCNRETSVAM